MAVEVDRNAQDDESNGADFLIDWSKTQYAAVLGKHVVHKTEQSAGKRVEPAVRGYMQYKAIDRRKQRRFLY